jgi:hypothetical protein
MVFRPASFARLVCVPMILNQLASRRFFFDVPLMLSIEAFEIGTVGRFPWPSGLLYPCGPLRPGASAPALGLYDGTQPLTRKSMVSGMTEMGLS